MNAEAIVDHHAGWAGPWVEDEVFGTHDPAAVAAALEGFLGEPAELVFYEASVGVVAGLELDGGRRVVVKAHRPGVPVAHLGAMQHVQRTLAERGFPCPRPIDGPRPLGSGVATVEDLVDEGERRDAHDPTVRRALAETLARLVETAADLVSTPGLLRAGHGTPPGKLWPTPHSRIFDFDATRAGTEWIDAWAERSRGRQAALGRTVVGHTDWSVKHFRFVGDRVSAVYDWDSVQLSDEPRVVGHAAATFTVTWYLDVPLLPTPDEARAFVSDYEHARGRSFDAGERHRLAAAATYILAYSARCESCGDPTATDFPAGSMRETLARHGAEFLRI